MFHDHADGGEIQTFYARGRVISKSRKELLLETWGPLGLDDDNADGHNSHTWAISRPSIIHIDIFLKYQNARTSRRNQRKPAEAVVQDLPVVTEGEPGV